MHIVFVIVVLWALLRGAAAAEPGAPPGADDELARRFRLADRNGDGTLSRAEAQQAGWFVDKMERFESIDRDDSGTVTLAEIATAIAEQVQDWLGADTDHDGRVTEAEAARRPGSFSKVLKDADADGDRAATRAELEGLSQRGYYEHSELPPVAPNIIEKRF
jgi:hypothetical protein